MKQKIFAPLTNENLLGVLRTLQYNFHGKIRMMASKFATATGIITLLTGATSTRAIDLAAIKAGKFPKEAKEKARVCAALFAIAQLMEQADQKRPLKPDPPDESGTESALSPAQQRLDAEVIAEAKAQSDIARSDMFGSFAEAWGNRAAALSAENTDTFFDKTLQSDAESLLSLKSDFPVSPADVRAFPDAATGIWLVRCAAKIRSSAE